MLVDYDNLEARITQAGPVNCAKVIAGLIPDAVFSQHDSLIVRLYGGWRANGSSSRSAQRIVPDIQRQSPTVIPSRSDLPSPPKRLIVELAEGPLGSNIALDETLATRRNLRSFRADPAGLAGCTDIGACSMRPFYGLTHRTPCANPGCASVFGDLFVRDEQKMVDTLLVADIAQYTLQHKPTDMVIVSSDTDMWPGVYLALRSGCAVLQIHTRSGGRTQGHLLRTLLPRQAALYSQISV